MTLKKSFLILGILFLGMAAQSAKAQGRPCGDSPENPTIILAGLASGAYAVSAVRTRFRARRSSRTE
jgi:XrtJ-associated TM-motif-TM protein